jgi:biopolymer transport protein ExbD
MAFNRWREARPPTGELDLIPVMNLFMVLIPFLLMGAAFYHIAVIPGSLPQHADTPAGGEAEEPRALTANLQLRADRLSLTFAGPGVDPDTLGRFALELQRGADGFDANALRARLRQVKAAYPESDTMMALPDRDVAYQDLVAVLDVARELPPPAEGEAGAPLFPVVVFSRLLEAPADAPAEGEEAP